LLIVKFALGNPIRHRAVLVDLLDWLDYAAYDAGPGQIMLRERDFFAAIDKGCKPAKRPMAEKVEHLFRRFEDGVEALIRNRSVRLKRQRKQFDKFDDATFVVDQSKLKFVP
jgi:hypothetical protein